MTSISPADLRLLLAAVHLSHEGITQVKIAETLGISPSKVSRLLSRAPDFVELRYVVPEDERLAVELTQKFRLADAVVVETGSREQETRIVGQAAASYFRANVQDRTSVAISCGYTLLEFTMALPRRLGRLAIHQMSVEGDPTEVQQAPSTLAGLLRAKASEGSTVFGIQLPPANEVLGGVDYRRNLDESEMMARLREEARACDFVFMGVGTPVCQEGGQPSSFVRLAESIIGKDEYRQAIDDLSIVGEINNQLFDERGVDRNREFPDLDERFVNILSLQDLRAMAAKPGAHRVVTIAAGMHKASALRTALSSGLTNVVITSRELAETLLETSGKSSPDRDENRRQR